MTGSSSWITKVRREAIYGRDLHTCVYCQKDLSNVPARERGLDHLEDLVNGGGHVGANHKSTNLVTACARCNSSRGARSYTEFAAQFPGALARIEATRHAAADTAAAKARIAADRPADREIIAA